MLQLKTVVKEYVTGGTTVAALRGVDLEFRQSEFVAILGPSGCGKTTLLNIVGGLDRYTSGDLVINGVSTKEYKDVDWDIYRNNSVGFVFQTYNLIPHQSVLSNVELAMTLAGISASERKRRATEALERVGLGDQLRKKPNQMSGGQMQRVAIARALVNNPSIILADEPTGALDSETSVQIMEILKEIAKDRLVVMVTHNPDLADKYATRTIRLLDGKVISDSNPFTMPENKESGKRKKRKKISMSFWTALSLSMNNLLTKKGRTFLTAFAGSIGIIGIALILSMSDGMQRYIDKMETDTLSTYPLIINNETVDLSSMTSEREAALAEKEARELDKVYTNKVTTNMLQLMSAVQSHNDLAHFKQYLESEDGEKITDLTNTIEYGYDLNLQIFKSDTTDGVLRVNPSNMINSVAAGLTGGDVGYTSTAMDSLSSMMFSYDVWSQMIGNDDLLQSQYDVIAGKWPDRANKDEIVLIVDGDNEISDIALYSLGILDQDKLADIQKSMITSGSVDSDAARDLEENEPDSYTYDDILNLRFKLVMNTDYYVKEGDIWVDKSTDEDYMKQVVADALELKVVGILRPAEGTSATAISGSVAYTTALMEYAAEQINGSEIVKEQKEKPDVNVLTGVAFDLATKTLTMDDVNAYMATLPEDQQEQAQMMLSSMTDEQIIAMFEQQIKAGADSTATYDGNLTQFGVVDLNSPSSVSIYPKDYLSKDNIKTYIADYNDMQEAAGNDGYVIRYTDIMGLMMAAVTDVINIITYVLIGFVSVSLVVSSIMIGIITYISVLERTKEIGILRSIGASKRDVSRVFTAETLIVGLSAGLIGIFITMLLNIPINIIIDVLAGVSDIAALPLYGAVGLVLVSVLLTIIAGLFPSRVAAKKDPVEALRTE
jgi:putative ABC transport system permease protein